MRVALAQICTGSDVTANLELIRANTADAAAQDAQLVVFPEAAMCAFGNPLGKVAEPLDGPFATAVIELAREHNIMVIVGMFTPGDEGRVRNTLLATDGVTTTSYDKLHLYDAFGFKESETITPGESLARVACAGIEVGLSLCYDVRFPRLYIANAQNGARLQVVCASWGAGPRKIAQWELLVQARALDSTSFVAACGQADPAASDVSAVPGAPTGVGHSMVVSPMGEVIAAAGAAPELLVVDLDDQAVDEARSNVPVLLNTREF